MSKIIFLMGTTPVERRSTGLLDLYHEKEDDFFNRILTFNESWEHNEHFPVLSGVFQTEIFL